MRPKQPPLTNERLEQFIRNEVLDAFEEVLQATVDKTMLRIVPCCNRKDNYERVKSAFIKHYLEPLIQYKFMEEMNEQE